MEILSLSSIPIGGDLSFKQEEVRKCLQSIAQSFADRIDFTPITISVVGCSNAVCPRLSANAHIHVSHLDRRGTICVKKNVLKLGERPARWLMAHEIAHLGKSRHGQEHRCWIVFLLGISPKEEAQQRFNYCQTIRRIRQDERR